jgi:glycosyltransferase involved in cell wall biosynthesis
MKGTTTKLAILIPSYNHEGFILDCIESALAIQVENKKVYVIDDGSSDGSVGVIKGYISSLENSQSIKFINKPINKGVIDTLKIFYGLCDSEYVLLLASDDVAIPLGIEKILSIMEKDKHLKFIVGGAINVYSDGIESNVYGVEHDRFFNLNAKAMLRDLFLRYPSPILSQSSVIRYEALELIGGWDETLETDDFAMFMKLLQTFPTKGVDFYFLPEIECVYYRHHSSNSHQNMCRQLEHAIPTLEKLAPKKLLSKAVGFKSAYYLLAAIKNFNLKLFFRLILRIPFKYWFYSLYSMLLLIVRRVFK